MITPFLFLTAMWERYDKKIRAGSGSGLVRTRGSLARCIGQPPIDRHACALYSGLWFEISCAVLGRVRPPILLGVGGVKVKG